MNKKFKILTVALAVVTMFSFCSCDVKEKIAQLRCEHEMNDGEVTKEPTEDKAGEQKITCTLCGYSVTLSIPATGATSEDDTSADLVCSHTGSMEIPGKMPTCTNPGLTTGYMCTACGGIVVPQEVLPALGHMERQMSLEESTCQKEGITAGAVCERCDLVLSGREIIPIQDCTDLDLDNRCDWCGEFLERVPVYVEVDVTDGELVAGNWYRIYRKVIDNFTESSYVSFQLTNAPTKGDEWYYSDNLQIMANSYCLSTSSVVVSGGFVYGPGPMGYYLDNMEYIITNEYIDIYLEIGTYSIISSARILGTAEIKSDTTISIGQYGDYIKRLELVY